MRSAAVLAGSWPGFCCDGPVRGAVGVAWVVWLPAPWPPGGRPWRPRRV